MKSEYPEHSNKFAFSVFSIKGAGCCINKLLRKKDSKNAKKGIGISEKIKEGIF